MSRCLIKTFGFIGDIFFQSSVAKKLKEERQFEQVDYVIGFPQVAQALTRNPYIDNVYLLDTTTAQPYYGLSVGDYDAEFQMEANSMTIAPPMEAQIRAGVNRPDTMFEIYTDSDLDAEVAMLYHEPYVAYMNIESWTEKAFRFTPEEYERGIDVPYLGYGGRLRNIKNILEELKKDFNLVEVGVKEKSMQTAANEPERTLDWDLSVLRGAQWFIGAEGGLCNFASGVGTRTCLTSEFVWQLYGRNGVIKKIPEPKLGPRYYFPNRGHIDLSPYLTDEQVYSELRAVLSGDKTPEEFKYEWFGS